ncbi:MAG TPA: DUF6263 family protein, partial [Sphingobacteriaceae bacterium]|nr:DUF6263 family protein [Sphingobacteriaceae bacterium]
NSNYRFVSNTNQNIVQELMGNTIEISQNIIVASIFEVVENTDGKMRIKAFYERIAMDANTPQGNVKIDSDNENDGDLDNAPELQKLSSMMNKPFYITLTSDGKLIRIEGLEKFIEQGNNTSNPFVKELLTEENVISSFENFFNVFSSDSVSMGETWNKNRSQGMNNQFELIFEESLTLEGLSEDIAWINTQSQINGAASENSFFDELNIEGTQQGTIEVERYSGLILFSEITQEIQGLLKMQGTEVPIKISSTSTHTGERL